MPFINFETAVSLLKKGEIVAFPTETVYGLGAIATNNEAILKIYKKKQRPTFNPLILHTSTIEQAQKYGKFNDLALQLAKYFWPGPLTLIVPKVENADIPHSATAGLSTIAIRFPDHEQAQKLITAVGLPLVAPSANPSGRLSPTCASHVVKLFNNTVHTLNQPNSTIIGLESTIIDCTQDQPIILRYGAITEDLVEKQLGICPFLTNNFSKIKAPGMLLRHYAPQLPLYINKQKPIANQAFITFGNPVFSKLPTAAKIFPLSPKENIEEAATNLFKVLHQIESSPKQFTSIGVMPIPKVGLGKAINDRLNRGAAK